MRYTKISGTGTYVPPRVVTNEDLAGWMETSDEWIRQRTGIEQPSSDTGTPPPPASRSPWTKPWKKGFWDRGER